MNEESSEHGTEGKGSRVESGTAATAGTAAAALAALAAAGLTASAHEQQAEEETEKQAAEREAYAIKRQLDGACIGRKQRAPYCKTLVPVLVPVVGRLKCMVKCIKGVDGVCGKFLSSKNIAKSAKDHCTWNGCEGVQIQQGQAPLKAWASSGQQRAQIA